MAPAEEVLDPGPVVWADVAFVRVRHVETGGLADVPADLVAHYSQRGWERTDSSDEHTLADETPTTTLKRRPTRKAQED